MIVVKVPYSNDRCWHGSSRSSEVFMRDALHGWVCDLSIEMNCYTTFYTTQSLDHGLFAFQRRVDAIRFVLEWT